MKKLILSVTALAGLTMAGNAQQVAFHDSNGASPVSYDVSLGGAQYTSDINAELLVGATSSTVTTPVVTLLLNGATATATTALGSIQPALGDLTTASVLEDLTQNAYKVAGGTDYYEILVWSGQASSYAAASAIGGTLIGNSGVVQFDLNSTPASGAPAALEDLAAPIALTTVTAVPEPSTLAMAGVGLASMLIFRRKNS
jgi:hypothetical protein